MRGLLIALLLLPVACGQPGTSPAAETTTPSPIATASPSPTASTLPLPSTSKSLLFAALEAKGTTNQFGYNTVAIVGLDGFARAATAFTPIPVPDMGCMGAVPPRSAHVAAGKVYFADGKGIVRSLSASGLITQVTTFPLASSQQMLSFAVSPDGDQLLGAVFTVPPKPNLACNGSPAPSGYGLDVYAAQVGGPSRLLYHQSLPAPPSNVMALTGWDFVGPVGTYPTVWASQGGGPGSDLGVSVRIDASTGKVLKQVSDPNSCRVWDMASSGDFTCRGDASATVSVRRPNGSEIWHFADSPTGFGYFLAPDEKHVFTSSDAGPAVVDRNGARAKVGAFYATGWLDSSTLVGGIGGTYTMAYVGLSAPGTVVSLGFPGLFVGTVRS